MSEPDKPQPNRPLPPSMRTRQPWPMWPIGLAILIFIGIYTFVNLEYRKEGKAYEPFQAMMDRKNAVVEKNMYDWYGLRASRVPDQGPIAPAAEATSQAYPNALETLVPDQLKYYMPTRPVLLPGFAKTESDPSLAPGQPLHVRIHVPAALAQDERLQLLAFYKEGDLYLLATLFVESIEEIEPADLQSPPEPVTFAVPTDPIAAESVAVRFLTDERLAQWDVANLDPAAARPEDRAADPEPGS